MGNRDGPDSPLNRRAFLGWAGKGALVVAFGGTLRTLGLDRQFIRPPGAVPEEEFISLCTRCHRCQEVCPYREIRSVLLTENVVSVGTPVLIDAEFCPRCRRCISSCPTGALR